MIPLLLGLAQAAPGSSLALDVGRLDSPHPAQEMLGGDALATYGFRYVHDLERWTRLDVTAGLRFSERRVDTTVTSNGGASEQSFETRWFHNTAALGLRLQGDTAWEGFQPYARAQLTVDTGVLRLDEDLDDKDNINQIRTIGVAPGAELVAGVDILTLPSGMGYLDVSPVLFLEMGWNRTALMDLDPIGDMRFGGFVVRTGLGLAF